MTVAPVNIVLNHVDEQILRTLVYYDIFNYPLTLEEVVRFLGTSANAHTVAAELQRLKAQRYVYQFGNFYGLQRDAAYVNRRIKGNTEAIRCMTLAKRKARLIASFPFVRAVLASGSLSKGYMDEASDLDFFIITAPHRLWIARTLLVMYKRIFLLNSHKHFCVNYFVDEDHLEIEEKNLFTATELATAMPLCGAMQYHRLHEANAWLNDFFPNYIPRPTAGVPEANIAWVKKVCERVINVFSTPALERYFRKVTLDRWRRLYHRQYNAADFQVAFKSKAYASKNHPRNYQRKVLDVYADKLKSLGIAPE